MRTIVAAFGLALMAGPALAQSVSLGGLNGRTATITAAEMATLPQVTLTLDAHGEKHDYQGPLLADVLAKVGAPTGNAMHGAELADAVVVKGADGYQVAFGLAEADPGVRPNRIILADRVDGHPLDVKEGPFRVVVEGDLKPMRSARMVTEIDVIRLSAKP